jgi:hypothetical protein
VVLSQHKELERVERDERDQQHHRQGRGAAEVEAEERAAIDEHDERSSCCCPARRW